MSNTTNDQPVRIIVPVRLPWDAFAAQCKREMLEKEKSKMTKEELFAQLIPLAKGADDSALRGVLETAWNHGIGEGLREAQAMMKAASPPSSVAEEPK